MANKKIVKSKSGKKNGKKTPALLVPFKKIGKLFRDIRLEMKKVVWPSRQQLINNTLTVLAVCLIIGVVIWVADVAFLKISTKVFG